MELKKFHYKMKGDYYNNLEAEFSTNDAVNKDTDGNGITELMELKLFYYRMNGGYYRNLEAEFSTDDAVNKDYDGDSIIEMKESKKFHHQASSGNYMPSTSTLTKCSRQSSHKVQNSESINNSMVRPRELLRDARGETILSYAETVY